MILERLRGGYVLRVGWRGENRMRGGGLVESMTPGLRIRGAMGCDVLITWRRSGRDRWTVIGSCVDWLEPIPVPFFTGF
jgi:hypothetical protein